MFAHVERKAPLHRNVDGEDVGKTAVYLLSDLSSGVTGGEPLRRLRLQYRRAVGCDGRPRTYVARTSGLRALNGPGTGRVNRNS